MSEFFKKFLADDARKSSFGGRSVALAAFGKHPGWDDHVEPVQGRITSADLGFETDSLSIAKTVFYVNGIGGQIDSGAWEKLDAAQQLPNFKHLFVWQRSGQILAGRLWSSSDGKGRKRYPMVVCAHFVGVPLGWALKQALPILGEIEEGCVQAASAEEVRSLLGAKRAALREAIQSADGRGEYAPVSPEALNRIIGPPGDPRLEGFLRVLYQVQSQVGNFAAGKSSARATSTTMRVLQIRVPLAGNSPEEALLFWTRFFVTQVNPTVPLLLTLPLEGDWLDVTAGEPESHEFFCLRASPKAVPLVSEVPYTFEDAFRTKATAFFDGFRRGETAAADFSTADSAATADETVSGKRGWLKWFGLFLLLAIGAIAAVFLFPPGARQQAKAKASATNPPVAIAPPSKPQTAPSAPAPSAADIAKARVASETARLNKEAEAARLAEEKKTSNALFAAARLKGDIEAAAREKERLAAETARLEKERAAAIEKELARQKALAEQKARAEKEAKPVAEIPAPKPNPAPVATAVPAVPATHFAARDEMTNSIGMVLVQLPNIWVGKYEVTQSEYRKVMGANPSKSENDRQPVEKVTWNEAREFCRRLTELEHGRLQAGKVYTLPTQAQWNEFLGGQKFEELPGRGTTGRISPAVVGQAGPPNKFGLFDVLGNVWEWCLDTTPNGKVLKGGAFNNASLDRTLLPEQSAANCGFRCVVASP